MKPQIDAEIQFIIDNRDKLTPEEQESVMLRLKQQARGFRSNKYIDTLRPNLYPGHPRDNPKQRAFLGLECIEAFYGGAAGGGKQVLSSEKMQFWRSSGLTDAVGDPILQGMIDRADEIRVGDFLIGSDGEPKRVLAISDPEYRQFFTVRFDDGTSLAVSGDHLWTVFDLSKRARGEDRRGNFSVTMTTEQIIEAGLSFRSGRRFAIPLMSGPCRSPNPSIPKLPPYTLGYWLGNGSAQGSTLTCHTDDAEEIARYVREDGIELKVKRYDETANRATILINGWNQALVEAGWKNEMRGKYRYFFKDPARLNWQNWSVEDRRNLLSGLLDSDGHANKRGDIEFDNTDLNIVVLAQQLMRSLGMKPSSPSKKQSRRKNELPIYRICSTVTSQVFRLKRKADRVNTTPNQKRTTRRYIDSIDACGHKEGICFKVDSEDKLYVAGPNYIVTHNSDALLLAALQYCDVPGYSAIMFRRTYTDLAGEGALMSRAIQWMAPFVQNKDCRWSGSEKSFFFNTTNPDGSPGQDARLAFAYLDSEKDRYRYLGWEFTSVFFDEVCQHPEENYTYLFSRLRRLENVDIPIRMRSGSNPGGELWVKERMVPQAFHDADQETRFNTIWQKNVLCEECNGSGILADQSLVELFEDDTCFYCEGVGQRTSVFVPARLQDNKSLDRKQYLISLSNLKSPIERARLERGDWDIQESGDIFRLGWFRYYSTGGNIGRHFHLHDPDSGRHHTVDQKYIVHFITADTASKEKTTADYTVICLWAYDTRGGNLMLLGMLRDRMEIPAIRTAIVNMYNSITADFAIIEESSIAIGVIQDLRSQIVIKPYIPGDGQHRLERDKISRSSTAAIMAEEGRIYLPAESPRPKWLNEFISEVILFGPDCEYDDIMDNVTMAAWYVNGQSRRIQSSPPSEISSGPLTNRYVY